MTTAAKRQLGYWWALTAALGDEASRETMARLMTGLVDEENLPRVLLDERASVSDVLRADKTLEGLFGLPRKGDAAAAVDGDGLKRQMLFLKSVLNVFGRGGQSSQAGQSGEQPEGASISASDYSQWLSDVRAFERACGYDPGSLLHGRGAGTSGDLRTGHDELEDALSEMSKGRGLLSEPEIQAGLRSIEKRLIDRMSLSEVLADSRLAQEITPSMAMVEQLLRQKGDLSGVALRNAKKIIRRYVDELRDVLARQVESAKSGGIDYSVPPKRVFSNLDLKRTLWKNLTNYNPEDGRLYIDRLYYKHTARKKNKTRLIVVVDQSGSMIPAMINCTILASIFAGLPQVEPHLIAFDTTAIDLSAWVHDPFEVLLRTQLGGGNDGMCVLPFLNGMVTDPRQTVVVWISDFYDTRDLMPAFAAFHRSGMTFIPVGSVSTGGYFSVEPWFRKELKRLGTPVLSGSLKTLIRELKAALP